MLADNLTTREHAAKKNRTGPETDACGTPGVTLSDIGVTQGESHARLLHSLRVLTE